MGLVRAWMIFSSSWQAWPDTCSMSARRRKDDGEVCRTVKSSVSSYLYKHTKRSPMIIPMVTKL